MRDHLCDILEELWQTGTAQRYQLSPRSAVPLLDNILLTYAERRKDKPPS
jgi:hypothetical protein